MCDCIENSMIVGSVKMPKARVGHRCGECLRDIQPGERYENVSGVWRDSGANTQKTCIDCVRLRDEVLKLDCFCYGQLMDYVDVGDSQPEAEFFRQRIENWNRRAKAAELRGEKEGRNNVA